MDDDKTSSVAKIGIGVAAAAGTLIAIAGIVLAIIVTSVTAGIGDQQAAQAAAADQAATSAGSQLKAGSVPKNYAPWINRAGTICPEITPPVIAAQIFAESSFEDHPANSSGAAGPGQFTGPAWQTWGTDADNDGKKDLHSVADAVVSTGRMDCDNVQQLAHKYPKQDAVAIALAAYHDGTGAVSSSGGVPNYPLTRAYIAKITTLARTRFTDPHAASGVGAAAGGWVNPVPKGWTVGAVFHQAGSWSKGWHTGYDFAIAVGTPIYAAGAGTVAQVNPNDAAWGNQIVISHGRMQTDQGLRYVQSTYNHLHDFHVKVGDSVKAGQLIGHVGLTGRTFGPHLHFEIHASPTPAFNWNTAPDSDFINPWTWLQDHRGPAPAAAADNSGTDPTISKAIAIAKAQSGKPYVMATEGPQTFDCSGLVIYAYLHASGGTINLGNTRTTQVMVGDSAAARANFTTVPDQDKKPGDLIFFQTEGPGNWSHVGLYIGKVDGHDTMVEAANPHSGVVITTIDSGYYGPGRARTIRRVKGA